jgi:hypothetical protein
MHLSRNGERANPATLIRVATVLGALLALAFPAASLAVFRPPITRPPIGVIAQPRPPLAPGLYPLQPSPLAVTVRWYDRSTDEQKFVLYRRDQHGAWQAIYEVPTHNVASADGDYSYVDTDRSISGQCYMIAAVNDNGAGYTQEECTVRPDPSRFPQSVPSKAVQWYGLTSVNDGTGDLANWARSNSYKELIHANQWFGVDLDWSQHPTLWKIEAQGGPHVMKGQAVALRVWGGGWLKHGNQTWGVDLVLSSTPAYEWYVLSGQPGSPIDSGKFALWNSAARDYLVAAHQTWGVDLDWYKNTQPAPTPPPPHQTGVRTFVAYNCVSEQRPLEMWVADLTAGTGYADMGRLDSQWTDGGCPGTGQPWTFTPQSGHQYLVRAVDYLADGCSNDPTIGPCWRSETTFVGDANGNVISSTIG